MNLPKYSCHNHYMYIKTLTLILTITFATKISCQDQNTIPLTLSQPATSNTAGQLCISECGTCPVICSSPPTVITPLLPPSPSAPPQKPPPWPPQTIQPLLPPPPTTLPPLLPLLPPSPVSYFPPPVPKVAHQPPPPPAAAVISGGPPKSGGGSGGHSPPSPSAAFPYVINPGGPSPPYPYYYFYESSGSVFSSLPLTSRFSVIVIFGFHVVCGFLVV